MFKPPTEFKIPFEIYPILVFEFIIGVIAVYNIIGILITFVIPLIKEKLCKK